MGRLIALSLKVVVISLYLQQRPFRSSFSIHRERPSTSTKNDAQVQNDDRFVGILLISQTSSNISALTAKLNPPRPRKRLHRYTVDFRSLNDLYQEYRLALSINRISLGTVIVPDMIICVCVEFL